MDRLLAGDPLHTWQPTLLALKFGVNFACESLTHAPVPTPSTESGARMRYDVQRAEAYQVALASELQQHFIPLIQHELDVDLLADKFVACLTSAINNTMPHVRKHSGVHSRSN